MNLPHKKIEVNLFKTGVKYIAAVDEAGRGPLAGPVMVASVLVSEKFIKKSSKLLKGVKDSKMLSEKQREILYEKIISNPDIFYSTSFCMPTTIDRINIFQATNLAMKRSVEKLIKVSRFKFHTSKIMVLVDGNKEIRKLNIPQRAIINGDQKVFSIACASIIAKVTRDRMMRRYSKKFPDYKFHIHKGYGTRMHKSLLIKFGPCEIHRKSFAPVSELL